MNIKHTNPRIITYLLIAAGLTLGVIYFPNIMAAIGKLGSVFSPIIMGFVYAYILNILIKKIRKLYFPGSKSSLVMRTRGPVSIILAIIVVLAVVVLIMNIVVPQVINAISTLANNIPVAIERVSAWLEDNEQYVPDIARRLNVDMSDVATEVNNFLMDTGKTLLSSVLAALSALPATLVDFFLSLAVAVYFLAGKERLITQLRRVQDAFMKRGHVQAIQGVLSVANETFTSYIGGQFTEAMILGTLCTAGMLIFRFPYATTIGVFIGATALIPIIGAYIGAGVGAFLIVMVDPIKAAFFLIYIIILQQLENNLIYPKVVGTSIGLPGLWVMVAVIVGGGLGGIPGMMLGVPLVATLYKLMQAETRKRLKKH